MSMNYQYLTYIWRTHYINRKLAELHCVTNFHSKLIRYFHKIIPAIDYNMIWGGIIEPMMMKMNKISRIILNVKFMYYQHNFMVETILIRNLHIFIYHSTLFLFFFSKKMCQKIAFQKLFSTSAAGLMDDNPVSTKSHRNMINPMLSSNENIIFSLN